MGRDDGITMLGSSTWGRDRPSRVRDPTNLLPLHFLLKADNYLNMPASFLPSRAFTSVIQQHVCEWKTSTALGTRGQQSRLPDTPAACRHSSGTDQVSWCRGSGMGGGGGRGQNAERNHRNQQWTNQGASGLTMYLCQTEVRGRLNQNDSKSGVTDNKSKHQPRYAYTQICVICLDHTRSLLSQPESSPKAGRS